MDPPPPKGYGVASPPGFGYGVPSSAGAYAVTGESDLRIRKDNEE